MLGGEDGPGNDVGAQRGRRGQSTEKPPLDLRKEAKQGWLGPVREVARGARGTGGSGAG